MTGDKKTKALCLIGFVPKMDIFYCQIIGLDKSGYQANIFSYFSMKTNVVEK